MDILVWVIVVLFTYVLIRSTFSILGFSKPKNLPPGPTSLPIIGNLHLLGNQPHRSLAKLAQTHGPIMLLKLGQKTTLVITSTAAAKEVLQKQDLAFSNRHIPDALHAHNFSEYSLTVLPIGTQWRFLRRIVHTNIFSDKSLEAKQQIWDQKVKELIAFCQKACMSKDYVDIGGATFTTSMNLISNTLFSKDFINSYEEDSSKEFRDVVTNILVDVGKPNLVDFFPVLKKIDPQGIRRRMTRHFGKILAIFEELIEDRLAMRRSVDDDVLEVCLKISQDSPEELNRSRIKFLMLDMFVGGTDTTSTTVEWAMTELLRNPDVMAKSKDELKHVIGKGKNIKDHDLSRLPYLLCIVNETLRLHPPVPLLIPRNVENPVKLCGYIIPKDTQVLVNAWAIGQDPTIWEDSKEFKPERFLTRQIDVRGQDFELIPFGAGRRICPGFPLALRTIPIILGSLVNNFDWNLDVNLQPKVLDMTERFGISLHKANPLCLIPMPLN
ncbi:putative geraniol 8-hydroxylase [Helianthus annuus]|nr:putative geraniol 8-hydroxylase [Helianthus annuus]KAJ0935088.1 putative geraniol 8-hydroxylase [Helianthus annuus]